MKSYFGVVFVEGEEAHHPMRRLDIPVSIHLEYDETHNAANRSELGVPPNVAIVDGDV